jgi:hypothetical protein
MFKASSLLVAALSLTAVSSTGCVVRARGQVQTAAYVEAEPELVYVSPGVYVVAEQDDPVFYSDNYYWRYDGGVWYRSSRWGGGWVVYNSRPARFHASFRPQAYVRVRARGNARGHVRARGHGGGRGRGGGRVIQHDSGRRGEDRNDHRRHH